jgi:hypothetical protein
MKTLTIISAIGFPVLYGVTWCYFHDLKKLFHDNDIDLPARL